MIPLLRINDAGGHCAFGAEIEVRCGKEPCPSWVPSLCCPWGGLMSLGHISKPSSCPPAPHMGTAKLGHAPAPCPWCRGEGDRMGPRVSCCSHPSRSSPAPPELRAQQAYLYLKEKTEGREKEQQWQERERLSRALHKNDKLLLDIGQERKRVLLYLMILVS